MKILLAALGAFLFACVASAQQVTTPQAAALVCSYNSSPPTITSGNFLYVQCDSAGKVITSGGSAYLPLAGGALTGAVTSTSTLTLGGCTLPTNGVFCAKYSSGANTYTPGVLLANVNAATSGNQQGACDDLEGQGWGTTAPASAEVEWLECLVPVQGTVPTANLTFGFREGGSGSYSTDLTLTSGGNVGIGTTAPTAELSVAGTMNVGSSGALFTSTAWISTFLGGASQKGVAIGYGPDDNGNVIQGLTTTSGYGNLVLNEYGGNVGIDTTSPNYPLDVVGAINTSTVYYAGGIKGVTCPTGTLVVTGISGGVITAATSTGGSCS